MSLIGAFLFAAVTAFAELPAPLEEETVKYTWLGHDRGLVAFTRLKLEDAGRGVLVLSPTHARYETFAVTAWGITNGLLTISIKSPGNQPVKASFVNSTSVILRLRIELGREKWVFEMFREDRFFDRLDKLKKETKDTTGANGD